MKANKLQSYSIIFRSILTTLKTSLLVLLCCLSKNKKSRKRIDQLLHRWSGSLLKIAKIHCRVLNPHEIKLEPHLRYVLMSNHSSNYDIPLIYKVFQHASIRMMAKKELFKVPVWGNAMRESEFISVDRNNSRQAILDLKYAREKLESGIVVWVAPEGTRSKTGKLLAFKKGGFMLAKKTEAIIIPIGIRGANDVLPSKSLQFNLNQQVELHIGEPIDSAKYDKKDLAGLMEATRQQLEKLTNQAE